MHITYWFGIFIIATAFSLPSCSKDRDILFNIPIQLRFEIPAGLNPVESHNFLIRNVPTNIEILKDRMGVEMGEPINIRPNSAIMRSLFQTTTFEFVDEVEISLFDGFDPEMDTEAFITDFVPIAAGTSVILVPFETDVEEYVAQRFIHLKVKLRLRAPTPSFIETEVELSFDAKRRE